MHWDYRAVRSVGLKSPIILILLRVDIFLIFFNQRIEQHYVFFLTLLQSFYPIIIGFSKSPVSYVPAFVTGNMNPKARFFVHSWCQLSDFPAFPTFLTSKWWIPSLSSRTKSTSMSTLTLLKQSRYYDALSRHSARWFTNSRLLLLLLLVP